jgi:hypothetical protein
MVKTQETILTHTNFYFRYELSLPCEEMFPHLSDLNASNPELPTLTKKNLCPFKVVSYICTLLPTLLS